jgi:hypothetical protein
VLRVLSGLLFLFWLLPLCSERIGLFSLDGWFDRQAYLEASRMPGGSPVPLGWSVLYAASTNHAVFDAIWWSGMAVLVLFTLGIATRLTAVLTWVFIVSCLASPAVSFDADFLLGILALYLMVAYLLLGQWSRPLTLLERLLGPRGTSLYAAWRSTVEEPASYAANLAIRLIQVHFVLVILTTGFHKLQFGDWWSGVAYWYALHPALQMDEAKVQLERRSAQLTLFVLSLAAYLALAWQITFPLFAFRPRWRVVLLGGAAIGWLGAIFIFKQPILGPVLMLVCMSYLRPEEWRWLKDRLAGAARFVWASRRTAAPAPKVKVKAGM